MKPKTVHVLEKAATITAGCGLAAFAVSLFLVPYRISPGGVTGLSAVLHHLLGMKLPLGLIIILLNIPLFLIGFKTVGVRFVLNSLFGTACLSGFIQLSTIAFSPLMKLLYDVSSANGGNPSDFSDLTIYALVGGFMNGAGLGIVLRAGATTGGSDLAARIVHHFFPGVPVGRVLLGIDALVVITSAIVFKSARLALYSLVSLFISSRVIDAVIEGVDPAKAVYIISNHTEILLGSITGELKRGATVLSGWGAYSGQKRDVLLCVVERWQLPRLKSMIKDLDHNAFLVVTDAREVLGEGFRDWEQGAR